MTAQPLPEPESNQDQTAAKPAAVPAVDPEKEKQHKAAVAMVARDFAFDHDILPMFYHNMRLTVAMEDPTDQKKLDAIVAHTRVFEVLGQKVSLEQIRHALPNVYPRQASKDETPIEQLFDQMVKAAVTEHASDIHIEPFGAHSGVIRFRVDGTMLEHRTIDGATLERFVTHLKVKAGVDISEKNLPLDGRFEVAFDNSTLSVRAAFVTGVHGQKVALRILGRIELIRSLDELGLDKDTLKTVKNGAARAGGFVVISGPVGSGKSTMLYSMIRGLNLSALNAYSVEDPVEMVIPGLTQLEVNEKAGMTFAEALRAFVRQDPNLIFIGELRDEETVKLCLQASTTGLSLMATTHAKSAVHIVDRLEELGGSRQRIAATLTMGISQRLVGKLCRFCKKPAQLSGRANTLVQTHLSSMPTDMVATAVGCPRCNGTGYTGRFVVIEVMEMYPDIADAIRSRTSTPFDVAKAAHTHNYTPMMIDGLRHVLLGDTSEEELLKKLAYEDMLI